MSDYDEYPDTSSFETSGCDESEYCFEHSCRADECEDCQAHEDLHGWYLDGTCTIGLCGVKYE